MIGREEQISENTGSTIQEISPMRIINSIFVLIAWTIIGSLGAFGGFLFVEFAKDLSIYELCTAVVGLALFIALIIGANFSLRPSNC